MSEVIKPWAEWAAVLVEGIGIGIMTIVSIFVIFYFFVEAFRQKDIRIAYSKMRQLLGRSILLGLEFLVAADIIHTVAVDLTFKTVGVLAIIILIRTFLSWSLELELTGRWPWQSKK